MSSTQSDGFPRTGEMLLRDIHGDDPEEHPIIEDFLFEGDVLMLFADAGMGKSVIVRQIMACLSSGTPLFGGLAIPEPKRVYYVQLEGNYRRYTIRFRRLGPVVPYDAARIFWDDARDVDLMNSTSYKHLLDRILATEAQVVILDPIYKLVPAEIAQEGPSKAIIRFSDALQLQLQCAMILVHHTKREQYTNQGQRMNVEDAYYGSTWLKAHVDTSYQFARRPTDKDEGGLYCKKDRGDTVLKQILLHYDTVTDTVSMERDRGKMSGEELVVSWLIACKRGGDTTTFAETLARCQPLSVSHLRRIQLRLLKNHVLKVEETAGKAKVWLPQ